MTEKLKPVIEYYNDGTIKYAYHVDENGIEQGPYEEYHENGRLKIKHTYKDGKYDGPYEAYYRNGQLCVKCTYKDDKLDGPYEEYYDNGKLYKKCTYKDGKRDGLYEEYRRNGQLEKIKVYKEGNPLYGKEAEEYLKKNYPIKYIKYKERQAIELKKARALAGKQKAREKARKEREEKEAREKPIRERKGLNARLAQIDKQMAPTQLRQAVKRAEVAKFRVRYQKKCRS